jgi:hypothetical protein
MEKVATEQVIVVVEKVGHGAGEDAVVVGNGGARRYGIVVIHCVARAEVVVGESGTLPYLYFM